MALVKLVCRGCGTSLEVFDYQPTATCNACGTSTPIVANTPVGPARAAAPPITPKPTASAAPPFAITTETKSKTKSPATATAKPPHLVRFSLLVAGLSVAAGVGIAAFESRAPAPLPSPSAAPDQVVAEAKPEQVRYSWASPSPLIADLDGDGVDDLVGLVERGRDDIWLVALSGREWTTMWELAVRGRPRIYLEPEAKRVLVASGVSLTTHDGATGAQLWTREFGDAVSGVARAPDRDQDQLWVTTLDERISVLGRLDGQVIAAPNPATDAAVRLPDDGGYDLKPSYGTLDVAADQFAELRVRAGYCPTRDVRSTGRAESYDLRQQCVFGHGLAWAERAVGTPLPFMVGYERESKAERWRVQLTEPGTLGTIESGFDLPQAELDGDRAAVAFLPHSSGMRLRLLSLVDGQNQWEVGVPTRRYPGTITGIRFGRDRVFVCYQSVVHVFELATGEHQVSLGGY